jgi:hypothetical protein
VASFWWIAVLTMAAFSLPKFIELIAFGMWSNRIPIAFPLRFLTMKLPLSDLSTFLPKPRRLPTGFAINWCRAPRFQIWSKAPVKLKSFWVNHTRRRTTDPCFSVI